MTAVDPCPLGRAWCTQGEEDGGQHICQSADRELPSGWALTVKDFHEGGGPELAIDDPDCRLSSALVNRLSLANGLDLLAALAAAIRDAQTPDALPRQLANEVRP